ncbi:MAG: T9SS type A sorting domain-containing protein [Candidatus Cloacimonetes bacterium]|nr:T9SS type A sorting domain-containing protein [Candidatus Cloacimonadota bacterium]
MKRIIIVVFALLITIFVFANDFMKPAQIAIDGQYQITHIGTRTGHREQDPAPEYSFILNGNGDPTTFLTNSYYDYMPYSYNGHNVRIQPEVSMPNGYTADGVYITYMRSETSVVGFDRQAHFSYILQNGLLGVSDNINSDVVREGFTSCAIDPYTADPFSVWHSIIEPDGSYDSNMSYYLYHAVGAEQWRIPFIVIDNPEISTPFTGHNDDEFIWPKIHIGPSPIPDHRRLHVYANNYTSNSTGNNNNNIIYLFADFHSEELFNWTSFDWVVQSFPYFDELHYNDIARINKDMIVSEDDGKVVFFGNVADSLFALYSDDYGETFTKYSQQLLQELPNLLLSNGQPMFGDEDWFALPSNDLTHYNGIFTDENTKVQWMSGVNYNSQGNINNGTYFAYYIYPKIFTFDTDTGEFSFYDIDIQDTDPGDDHLAVAYDLNDDGLIDDENYFPVSSPSWFFNSDSGWQDSYYHESNSKMSSNCNWVVCVWHDSAKLQNAYFQRPGYEGWVEQPEIAIVISDDNGETWSDIRYINANPNDAVIDTTYHYEGNYAPEFEGMLPVNVTLGDKLEIISNNTGNYHAKLHFTFMDDGDYGSAAGPTSNGGEFTNSALRYAAIDLEFQEEWIGPVSINEETIPHPDVQLFNYPNPFNPTTTISFNLTTEITENTELSIYNIKGQKIQSLINEQLPPGQHSIVWNGKDANNKQVGSGIYFYKLNFNGKTHAVRKCLLLK